VNGIGDKDNVEEGKSIEECAEDNFYDFRICLECKYSITCRKMREEAE